MGGRLLVWLGGWADRLSVAVERRLGIRLGSKAPCSGGAGGTVVVEPPCPPGADGGTTQKKLE